MIDIFGIQKQMILAVSKEPFETYETITNKLIEELGSKLRETEFRLNNHGNALRNGIENNSEVINDDEEIRGEISYEIGERDMILEYLSSLEEMKIVYLFKSLEIRIRTLLKTAYPKINTKETYKWNSMKNLFDSFDIDISKLDGYNEAQDLNKVNNCIKHSGEVSDELKKMKEFKNSSEHYSQKLRFFNDRVKTKIEHFVTALGLAIIHDLYHFDNNRLDCLCLSYINRMDKETSLKFIELFQNKLNEKSDSETVLA